MNEQDRNYYFIEGAIKSFDPKGFELDTRYGKVEYCFSIIETDAIKARTRIVQGLNKKGLEFITSNKTADELTFFRKGRPFNARITEFPKSRTYAVTVYTKD